MDATQAARRWARTWEAAWAAHDVEAIAALYAEGTTYRSSPFREAEAGGARGFTTRTFADESGVRCRFAEPLVDGSRATVEWWAELVEDGEETTLAGATVLSFDAEGLVVDHVDYWQQAVGRREPYPGWAAGR